ncbi:hypothetical protein [Candidatus Venteria ishoeyi]|uniref:Antitoxin YefM n=1 Tax=Candidatus Venteria ishoeyi TaxID=1899563 RepID=A0A1H6FIC2_9GAMM|nr:hypothetical protein [Candidatus Venteria ishoeyi]SEH08754.1 Uncharacterised protein [Candidatus Venteria ishoeyi]SEH08764.1 Uncharacterised protein [Candidatus Venteria ishoeyi]
MYSIYKMQADELNKDFLDTLKTLFKHKQIEIVISEAEQVEENETNYLLHNANNREHLMKALENIAQKKNLVSFDIDDLT